MPVSILINGLSGYYSAGQPNTAPVSRVGGVRPGGQYCLQVLLALLGLIACSTEAAGKFVNWDGDRKASILDFVLDDFREMLSSRSSPNGDCHTR